MKPLHIVLAVIGGAIAGATVGLLLAPESQSIEMKLMSSAAIDPDRARALLYKHVYRAE